jgi:protein disulfide-isomerase-like protein
MVDFCRLALFFLWLPACSSTTQQASVQLTKDNFDEVTQGKTVFIKFYAPWCGHCQNLAPTWEELAADWVDHKQGLVAEVDCTIGPDTEKWCSKEMQIEGFPTLLYGDTSNGRLFLTEYNGEKTFEALSAFASDTISTPYCTPINVDACDMKTKKMLQSYLKLSVDKINKEIAKVEKKVDNVQSNFQKKFQRMQSQYDEKKQAYELFAAQQKRTIKELKSTLTLKEKQKNLN